MGNYISRKFSILSQPRIDGPPQYTNRCSACGHMFMSPFYKDLSCPICIQKNRKYFVTDIKN